MACNTVIPTGLLEFGIAVDEAGLIATQSVRVTKKQDKKEARDKCGIVVACALYNPMADVEIEGLGSATTAIVGQTLVLNGVFGEPPMIPVSNSKILIEEVTLEKTNEDFVKISIKAAWYSGIVFV
jgi:hypothetical protein